MDIPEKSRFLFIGIIILVVLNIGLMAFIWYNHMGERRFPPPGEERHDLRGTEDFLARELKFDPEQIALARQLHERQLLLSDSIKGDISRLSSQIVAELFSERSDSIRIWQLSDAIGRKHAEFERKLFEYFLELKRICRPDQQEKLRQLIGDVLRRSISPPPPSGPDQDGFGPRPPGGPLQESSRPNPPPQENEPPLPPGH